MHGEGRASWGRTTSSFIPAHFDPFPLRPLSFQPIPFLRNDEKSQVIQWVDWLHECNKCFIACRAAFLCAEKLARKLLLLYLEGDALGRRN